MQNTSLLRAKNHFCALAGSGLPIQHAIEIQWQGHHLRGWGQRNLHTAGQKMKKNEEKWENDRCDQGVPAWLHDCCRSIATMCTSWTRATAPWETSGPQPQRPQISRNGGTWEVKAQHRIIAPWGLDFSRNQRRHRSDPVSRAQSGRSGCL